MINVKIGFSTLACPEWSWTDIYSMAKDFKFEMRSFLSRHSHLQRLSFLIQ